MRILTVICTAAASAFARLFDSQTASARNVDEYGEELAWMGGDMDGFELHDEVNGR
jgi:hypothetical protein